jgi:hypothetical protein
MNRRIVLLNIALLVLAGFLGSQLRRHWLEAKAHERAIFEKAAEKKVLLPPPPIATPQPVTASQYLDVAQKMLFSRDRNPDVIIEPTAPPPAPPPPPMPALPSYYGQIAIADPVVFFSVGGGSQKSFHKGDKVGPFELVSFDREKVVLRWDGKLVERKVTELAPKEVQARQIQDPTVAPPSAAAPAATASGVKSLGGDSSNANASKTDEKIGVPMGNGYFGCTPGDKSPAGTVIDGHKKVISTTLMGQSCHWEQVK